MAQSASKQWALRGIELFLDNPTMKSPVRWESRGVNFKLAILAKEGISNDILRKTTPDKIVLPSEPSPSTMKMLKKTRLAVNVIV